MKYETKIMGMIKGTTRWYGLKVVTYPSGEFHFTALDECYPVHGNPKTLSICRSETAERAFMVHDRIVKDLKVDV